MDFIIIIHFYIDFPTPKETRIWSRRMGIAIFPVASSWRASLGGGCPSLGQAWGKAAGHGRQHGKRWAEITGLLDLGRERAMVDPGKVPMVQYGAESSWPDMTQGHRQGQHQERGGIEGP